MTNIPRKLVLADVNIMMMHSLKLMFSISGLMMILFTIAFGGGSISFLMGKVSIQGIGYFIAQPPILTLYVICLLSRYRSGNESLSVGKELRNLFLSVLLSICATVILLVCLWFFQFYFSGAQAAEVQSVIDSPVGITPEAFKPQLPGFFSLFPLMFNMYSIAMFSIMVVIPYAGIIIGALVNCNAPLHRNLKLIAYGLWRNIFMMGLISFFSFSLFASWSFLAVKSAWMIYMSALPLVFLSVLSYVIAEQIFMPEKALSKTVNLKGQNPTSRA